jgi:hypothetical protein
MPWPLRARNLAIVESSLSGARSWMQLPEGVVEIGYGDADVVDCEQQMAGNEGVAGHA